MSNDVKRFLALNALLHGYSLEEAFQGRACDLLASPQDQVDALAKELRELQETEIVSDPLTKTILQFYRNNCYAFMCANPEYLVCLEAFASDDFTGKLGKGLSDSFIGSLIRDRGRNSEDGDPKVIDGVLYCSDSEFAHIADASRAAYAIYTKGPKGLPKKLNLLLRRHTSIADYVPLTALTLLEIIDGLLDAKIAPTMCQKTFLCLPDLMHIYKGTGCVMALDPNDRSRVNWLMDIKGQEDMGTCMSVSLDDIRSHLLRSVYDLKGSVAMATRSKETYSVGYPGD